MRDHLTKARAELAAALELVDAALSAPITERAGNLAHDADMKALAPMPGKLSSRTDYAAVNGRGVTLRTFDAKDHACEWVEEHACEHDGLHVVRVAVRVSRSVVFEPAPRAPRQPWTITQGATA